MPSLNPPAGWEQLASDEYTSTVATFVTGVKCVTAVGNANAGDAILVWKQPGKTKSSGLALTTHLHETPPEDAWAVVEVFRKDQIEMLAERFITGDDTIDDVVSDTIRELQADGAEILPKDPDHADPDLDLMTDGGVPDDAQWHRHTVRFNIELSITSELPRTPDELPPTLRTVADDAYMILEEAPAFDGFDLEEVDYIDIKSIEGDDGDPIDTHHVIDEDRGVAYFSTVSEGVITEYRLSLDPVDKVALCDGFIQQGESYGLYRSDVPEWVVDELNDRGYEIAE